MARAPYKPASSSATKKKTIIRMIIISKVLNIVYEFCVGKCLMGICRLFQACYFSCPPSTCIMRVILSPRNKIRPVNNRKEILKHRKSRPLNFLSHFLTLKFLYTDRLGMKLSALVLTDLSPVVLFLVDFLCLVHN